MPSNYKLMVKSDLDIDDKGSKRLVVCTWHEQFRLKYSKESMKTILGLMGEINKIKLRIFLHSGNQQEVKI